MSSSGNHGNLEVKNISCVCPELAHTQGRDQNLPGPIACSRGELYPYQKMNHARKRGFPLCIFVSLYITPIRDKLWYGLK